MQLSMHTSNFSYFIQRLENIFFYRYVFSHFMGFGNDITNQFDEVLAAIIGKHLDLMTISRVMKAKRVTLQETQEDSSV
jgi:hypothetical protein